jgi:hypothetical protein
VSTIRQLERRIAELEARMPKHKVYVSEEGHAHDLGEHLGGVSAARVYDSSGYSSKNQSTWFTATFDSERYDTDSMHDTSSNTERLTCKTAGKYHIIGQIEFAANAGVGVRVLRILLNGDDSNPIASVQQDAAGDSGSPVTTRMQIATVYDLSVDDYVQLDYWHNAGGTLSINATGKFSPEFMMSRIGPGGGAIVPVGTDHGGLSGLNDSADHTTYLTVDGSRILSGNLQVSVGGTVDGVDLDLHAADANAHHTESATGVTDHQDLTNRDSLVAHTQYPLRIADMIITGAWQWQNHQTYRELAAPTNPAESPREAHGRHKD